jgi:hypothetical protein
MVTTEEPGRSAVDRLQCRHSSLFDSWRSGGLSVLAVFWGRTAGVSWTPLTVMAAVSAGAVILLILLLIGSLIAVPAIVFFRACSIHFFADRYAPLRQASGGAARAGLPSPAG